LLGNSRSVVNAISFAKPTIGSSWLDDVRYFQLLVFAPPSVDAPGSASPRTTSCCANPCSSLYKTIQSSARAEPIRSALSTNAPSTLRVSPAARTRSSPPCARGLRADPLTRVVLMRCQQANLQSRRTLSIPAGKLRGVPTIMECLFHRLRHRWTQISPT